MLLPLVGYHGGTGEAGCVFDCDARERPAGAAHAALAVAIAGDMMADAVEAAELLAIDGDHLARAADDVGLRVQGLRAVKAGTAWRHRPPAEPLPAAA